MSERHEIQGGLAQRLGAGRPPDAEMLNMACFWVSRSLETLELAVPEAGPLVRRLLRVAGRVIIDTGAADADPASWANTEEMALLWLDEALKALGYTVKPDEGSDRPELPDPSVDWH